MAVQEINEKTDLTVSYTQEKRARTITGFKFTVRTKDKPKDVITHQRDPTPETYLQGKQTLKAKIPHLGS